MTILRRLGSLEPGTQFVVPETSQQATLIKVNPCRAFVQVAGKAQVVEIPGRAPFVASGDRKESWTPSMAVQVVKATP